MRLIWISPEMPFPPNTGGRIGIMKRLEYLAVHNEIYFFCIVDSQQDLLYVMDLKRYCKDVYLYNRNEHKLKNIIKTFIMPYACSSRQYKQMKNDIDACWNVVNPDYVVVDFPQMMGNLSISILESGKVVLNQHNIEYITLHNLADSVTNPLKKCIFLYESFRLKKIERNLYKKDYVKLYTFVSSEDKSFFENIFHKKNTLLVPVGTEVHVKEVMTSNVTKNIVFFGKMSYPPNAEAAKWFAKEVFGKIQAKYADAKLYLVGKDPQKELWDLPKKNRNIIVTGTVRSVDEYYRLADIVVVPLFHGGGVKVKLLEAFGYGKLVVSTEKGIEGTIFQNGKELITVSTADGYANVCMNVFENPFNYDIIRQNGLDMVREHFTWETVIASFEKTLLALK